MELISTSINRFQPIESQSALFEAERKYYGVGVQRLKQNQYFTGFFVFLARKSGCAAARCGSNPQNEGRVRIAMPELDNKPYIEHDPLIGYRYIPNTKLELPRPGGGRYSIQINSRGIRSDREYSCRKPRAVRRIIVCGDSMAAGQFVSNSQRFSELLERSVPDLEVINLSLEGSGTDQQVLIYEHVGLKYEHDLVLLLPFLQNIRRNMVEAREGIDAKTGQVVLRAKPRFEFLDGKLVLRNVPVAKELSVDPSQLLGRTDTRRSWFVRLKSLISSMPGAAYLKKACYGLLPWEPFPEYRDPRSQEWQLMAAIIRRFKDLAGMRPLVVAPTFYASYVRFSMARNYWDRYASLTTAPGIHAIDLLPHFRRLGKEALKCFQEPHDMHFSAYGNLVLADAFREELTRLGVL
jgi:hypothetical protein